MRLNLSAIEIALHRAIALTWLSLNVFALSAVEPPDCHHMELLYRSFTKPCIEL